MMQLLKRKNLTYMLMLYAQCMFVQNGVVTYLLNNVLSLIFIFTY